MFSATTRQRGRQFLEGGINLTRRRNLNPLLLLSSSSLFKTETNFIASPGYSLQLVRNINMPYYYGVISARPKKKYTLEEAIKLLREQCNSNPNSMVSVHLKMNLDGRIKSQSLSGLFDMPHSTRKAQVVAAATLDLKLAEEALKAGANHAGDLSPRILSREVQYPRDFDIIICTTELAHEMTGRVKLARQLNRYKIVPTPERKTLVEPEELCESVRKYAYGFYVPYQSDINGCVATRLGRFSEPDDYIVENFQYVLRHMFDTQLTQFGNGPDAKKKNIGKYILGIHMTSSQSDAFNVDLEQIEICRELNQQTIHIRPGGKWRMKINPAAKLKPKKMKNRKKKLPSSENGE